MTTPTLCGPTMTQSQQNDVPEMFYITLDTCPKGFTRQKSKKTCDCDPILENSVLSIKSCNLDNGTILRPANSYISADTNTGGAQLQSYRISSKCPFNYCFAHSQYIDLSTPDMQCQFNRCGVLCGQCQPGLSVIFGSSQCKQCSNVNLFIIAPLALAGIVLVIALFIFNLTVTDGTINPFIFYVNIISINFSLFFPKCHYLVDCLFISLLNLDLGIETCFYDGMSDYVKTLLRLSFPAYLIMIAICLIVGSRYSTKIQRVTAQRALPVLATLFLLSYSKILFTVCQVLFFYTFVFHIPDNSLTVMWMVDITVPLFGIKFLIVFLPCIVMFVILLFFNILLLLGRKLQRFKTINTFKPLLDAYYGPYKDKVYYWVGFQLLIRALIYGTSALNDKYHLTGGIILLGWLQCYGRPFKSKFKNIQESFILLNLQAVYAIKLLSVDSDDTIAQMIVQALISLILVNFVVSVIVHCVMLKCNKVAQISNQVAVHFKSKFINSKPREITVNMKDLSDSTLENYHEFRDPLIALDN